MQPSGDGRIPVFVFPNAITFYLEDKSSHKQNLTLYNPYDFGVLFRVLCTSPRKYMVVDPEGSIKAKCYVDIVVRHSSVSPANCQHTDKFRIQMYDSTTKQLMTEQLKNLPESPLQHTPYVGTIISTLQFVHTLLGRRDVTASLISGKPDSSTPDRDFESLSPPPPHSHMPQPQYNLIQHPTPQLSATTPNMVFLTVIAVVCIAVLFLPTEEDKNKNAFVPWSVSVNVKLAVAYVLGLVTMVILRPN